MWDISISLVVFIVFGVSKFPVKSKRAEWVLYSFISNNVSATVVCFSKFTKKNEVLSLDCHETPPLNPSSLSEWLSRYSTPSPRIMTMWFVCKPLCFVLAKWHNISDLCLEKKGGGESKNLYCQLLWVDDLL